MLAWTYLTSLVFSSLANSRKNANELLSYIKGGSFLTS